MLRFAMIFGFCISIDGASAAEFPESAPEKFSEMLEPVSQDPLLDILSVPDSAKPGVLIKVNQGGATIRVGKNSKDWVVDVSLKQNEREYLFQNAKVGEIYKVEVSKRKFSSEDRDITIKATLDTVFVVLERDRGLKRVSRYLMGSGAVYGGICYTISYIKYRNHNAYGKYRTANDHQQAITNQKATISKDGNAHNFRRQGRLGVGVAAAGLILYYRLKIPGLKSLW